jgi:hypothetical protein
MNVDNINELPYDVMCEIAKYSDPVSLGCLALTCRDMYNLFYAFSSVTVHSGYTTVFDVPITQKMIERGALVNFPKKHASWSHFVVTCRDTQIVNELLKITGGRYVSLGVKVFGNFDIEKLRCAPLIQTVEWTVDIRKTNYQEYLEKICSSPRLMRLTINVVGMNAKSDPINIDNIKPIVNAKRIHVTIRLQFRIKLFSMITDNIDNVTIVIGTKDVHRDKPHTGITFIGNRILEIKDLVMDNHTGIGFVNVGTAVLKNIKFGECHERTHSGTYYQPRDLFFDGSFEVPRLNSIRGNDMISRLHELRI